MHNIYNQPHILFKMTANRTPTSQTSRSEENKNDYRQSLGAYGEGSDSRQQMNIRSTSTTEGMISFAFLNKH